MSQRTLALVTKYSYFFTIAQTCEQFKMKLQTPVDMPFGFQAEPEGVASLHHLSTVSGISLQLLVTKEHREGQRFVCLCHKVVVISQKTVTHR